MKVPAIGYELWPLAIAVGGGVAVCGYAITRTLVGHNDIVINKHKPYQFQTKDSPKFMSRETNLKNLEEMGFGVENKKQ